MKFRGGEGRAEKELRVLRARGASELGQVASGFAPKGLWLGDGKVKF